MAMQFGRVGKIFNDLPGLFGYAALCVLIYTLQIKMVNRFILFTAKISFSIFLIHFLVLNLVQVVCKASGIQWSVFMLIPAIIICYVAAVPLQNVFDQLTGTLLNPVKPHPVAQVKK